MSDYYLAESATYDLEQIWNYLHRAGGRQVARRQITRLKDIFRLLAAHPYMGVAHEGQSPGMRRYPVPNTRYVIWYSLDEGKIEIVRVRHGSQETTRLSE